jgi:hypothetical protein
MIDINSDTLIIVEPAPLLAFRDALEADFEYCLTYAETTAEWRDHATAFSAGRLLKQYEKALKDAGVL